MPEHSSSRICARPSVIFGELLDQISRLRDQPARRVRLLAPRHAAMAELAPKLGPFAREYPDVVLDVTADDSRVDLVAAGFDAGMHLGEFIEQDLVVVGVSRGQRPAIVGSPEYFESHPKPKSPHDVPSHRCINVRHGSAGVYRWEFQKGDQSLAVAVNGPLIVDDVELTTRAAVDGVGLALLSALIETLRL
jgi:DNA-binding transcriptional LysR family regulator